MLQHLSFIFRNALRNRRRSLLTITSMAVSLCLLGLILSLYRGLFFMDDRSPAAARRLIVRHKVSLTQILPASYRQRIHQVPHVDAVSSWQWFGGVYKDARDPKNFFARFVVDPKDIFEVRPDLVMPDEQKADFKRIRTACIVSQPLAAKHGWKIGERITIVGDIFPATLELKLVGIFQGPDDGEVMFFSWDYMQESLTRPEYRDVIGSFILIVDEPENVPAVARSIDAMFANSPQPTKTETEKEMVLSFVAFLGNLRLFLAAVCGAVTFTILLVSANTVAMAVRERTRETAILRTLGFTPSEILGMILTEAVMLGAIGGILGAGLGYVMSVGMKKAMAGMFPFPLLDPLLAAVVVAVAIIVALLSAAVPAWFASRRNVVESLRFAG